MEFETRREEGVQKIKNRVKKEFDLEMKPAEVEDAIKLMKKVGNRCFKTYVNGVKEHFPEHIATELPEILKITGTPKNLVAYLKGYREKLDNPIMVELSQMLEGEGEGQFGEKIRKALIRYAMEKHLAKGKIASKLSRKFGLEEPDAQKMVEIIEEMDSKKERKQGGEYPTDYTYHS